MVGSETSSPFGGQDLFEDEVFADLDLLKADLSGKDFVRCTFDKMVLRESIWKGARLEDCVFQRCDLVRMQPSGMSAQGIAFANCRMMGVIWAQMGVATAMGFEACNLQYSSFVEVNLTGARFKSCRVLEANFVECRLVDVDFADSDMSGSRFEHCDLRNAQGAEAVGLFVDPSNNKVKDLRIGLATATLLATSFGMTVAGFGDSDPGGSPAKRRRR